MKPRKLFSANKASYENENDRTNCSSYQQANEALAQRNIQPIENSTANVSSTNSNY